MECVKWHTTGVGATTDTEEGDRTDTPEGEGGTDGILA